MVSDITALPDSIRSVLPDRARRSPPKPPPRTAVAAGRLAWLDVLRAIAVLAVVYQHFGARVLPGLHTAVDSFFDPGLYGVLIFFLVSGYIVPASLERKGSVRSFWISRLFRLFPLFATVIAATLLLHLAGLASLQGTGRNVTAAVLGHLLMLNDLLAGPNLIVVIWTLSYEMVFYLLLTALFTAGLHTRSGSLAGIFASGALLAGGVLPTGWLSYHALGLTGAALLADSLVLCGLVTAICARGKLRLCGAWLAGGTGLVLVLLNERRFGYEGLTILALMFCGTVLYRAHHGQAGRARALACTVAIFAAAMGAGAWHIPAVAPPGTAALRQREWIASVALAGLTFAAGLALRDRRMPSVLAWLGLVSYSIYLTLPLLLDLYDTIPFPSGYDNADWLQAAAFAIFAAALVGCAATSYYLVEAPMQRLGRRLTARLDSAGRPPPVRHPSGAGSARASAGSGQRCSAQPAGLWAATASGRGASLSLRGPLTGHAGNITPLGAQPSRAPAGWRTLPRRSGGA